MELDFKRIALEDKEVFNSLFRSYLPSISEYTFTNLFIWSDIKDIRYAKLDEGIVLKAYDHQQAYFLPPVGHNDCDRTMDALLEYGRAHDIRSFRNVPEHFRKHLRHTHVKVVPDRDNFDYVYKTLSLSGLKGWRLDGKRGFIRKFRENYPSFRYEPYTPDFRKSCLGLYEAWMSSRADKDPSVQNEHRAFVSFLDNFEKLDSVGGMVLVDDRIAGFSFGEKLNDSTFVVHFEKADLAFTGSYQMINQQFIGHEADGKFLFVNREQDLGIEGIRKAKLSYVPIRMIKKFRVTF